MSENGFYLEQNRNEKIYVYYFCLGVCLLIFAYMLFRKIFLILGLNDTYDITYTQLNMAYLTGTMKADMILILKWLLSLWGAWWSFKIIVGIWRKIQNYRLKYYHQ